MNKLQVIEHQSIRVLTTQQLAEAYETEVKNIQMNFTRNRERFIEGRDYYLLTGNDLKQFKMNLPTDSGLVDKRAPQLILWTDRGANRHSKILDTDMAWKQFDVLEETYFKAQKILSPMELLKLQSQAIEQVDEKVEDVTVRVKSLENTMTINSSQQFTLQKLTKERVVKCLGGKETQAYISLSKKVFSAIWRDYKDYFKIPSYRDTLRTNFEDAIEYLKSWRPEVNVEHEINYLNEIV